MTSVVEEGTPKTLLDAVQEVCKMSGVIAPTTLDTPDRNTIRAILAIKQALNLIWYKAKWDWRWRWWTMELSAGQMWYELPADYHAAGSTVGINKAASSLTFWPYEKLLEIYPNIRNMPPSFGNVDTEQEAVDANYDGNPQLWTIKGGYLGLWAPPAQDFIDSTSPYIVAGYYGQHIPPYDAADELGLPMDLMPALENMALGMFHHYREWPDWKITYDNGLGMLQDAVARSRQAYWENSQLIDGE
ncbi:MAG: hypothetical protein IPO08_19995 [Xanthomonadales bacterium]|nr:hypothetical protein [Xanthomonadales bacterium]